MTLPLQPVSQDTPRQHAAPASWPRAWRSLWLLLILPGLLSAGTARALDLDGPAGQHSVDIPTLAVVRDLPGHLLTSPPHEADDTPAMATAPAARHTLPQRGAVPLPAAPTLARHLERHPGHPRAPPALI